MIQERACRYIRVKQKLDRVKSVVEAGSGMPSIVDGKSGIKWAIGTEGISLIRGT
jgi:hypothetical protein